MKNVDDAIRKAILEEDAALAERIPAEPGIFDLLADTLKGRLRFLNLMGVVAVFVFLALGVACGVRFFGVETTREMIAWATGAVLCFTAVGMIKIWFWMELHRHAILREIKRVELEIAVLAGRLRDRS